MNETELREMDAWIAENVMGLSRVESIRGLPIYSIGETSSRNFHPTILSSDAMDVLKKCAEKLNGFELQIDGPSPWSVRCGDRTIIGQSGETLELAICKFAKQLFSK